MVLSYLAKPNRMGPFGVAQWRTKRLRRNEKRARHEVELSYAPREEHLKIKIRGRPTAAAPVSRGSRNSLGPDLYGPGLNRCRLGQTDGQDAVLAGRFDTSDVDAVADPETTMKIADSILLMEYTTEV